jgi:hypothetical protein
MAAHSQTRDAESSGGSSKTTKVLSLRRVHRTDAVDIQVIT